MAQRDFAHLNVREDGKAYSAFEIRCTKCPATLHFVQRGHRRLPPDAVKSWFAAKGWYVGNRPPADICPSCLARRKNLKIVKEEFVSKVVELKPEVRAEPPKEMTREERRIITAKLDEVYTVDRYVSPWTDAKMAVDLGVPQAWVADVRDAFFGPEGSNPEVDAYLAELTAASDEARKVSLAGAELAHEVERMREAVLGHSRAAQTVAAKFAELERRARKIEKDIGR